MKALTHTLRAAAITGLAIVSAHATAAATDFDADGRSDLFWRNSATGETYVYPMDGIQILGTEGYARTVADQNWQVVGIGDFNGDGKADILWRNSATGENYIYLMNGKDIVGEGYIRTVADQNWKVAGVGDFDGDGMSDILWRNAVTGENYLYPMLLGLVIKPTEGFLRTVADLTWRIAGIGDFDGDGISDILWRNSVTGENYLYPMLPGLVIKPTEGYLRTVADLNWAIVGIGDFDGGGKSDILWRNSATGENYIYLMNGKDIAGEGYIRTVPDQHWKVAGVGDLDRDAKADIVWRNFRTGENYVYPMAGTTITPTEGYIRVVADLAWRPILAGAAILAAPPPTITSVSGTVQTGQILTIAGTSMVDEDRRNWDPYLINHPNASGFEGAGFAADGWIGGGAFTYDSDIRLMGSKSARSHHEGENLENQPNISYNESLSITGDIYFRAYLRFKVANGIWANGYHKIFAIYGNPLDSSAFLDWLGNADESAYERIAVVLDGNPEHEANVPGGALQEDRWYCVEFKVPSGPPNNYKVWIDNQLVVDIPNGPWSPVASAGDMQFDVNHCCTSPGYSKDNWWDGFAVSRTRVGPASVIEIGDSPDYETATKVYQAPEYLSDNLSQIKVDLTGLPTGGPYYLWVTNNRGVRSAARQL